MSEDDLLRRWVTNDPDLFYLWQLLGREPVMDSAVETVGLTEGMVFPGLVVAYVTADGTERPGLVTKVLDAVTGECSLVIFHDGPNDGYAPTMPCTWASGIEYSEEAQPGSWHFAGGA